MEKRGFARAAAIYAIAVGVLMIAMWTFFLVSGQVPELTERPAEIILHLVAEFATAVILVAGGAAASAGNRFGEYVTVLGFGMLLYTIIVSPGYYVTRGETAFVAMFAVLFVATVVFSAGLLRALVTGRNER